MKISVVVPVHNQHEVTWKFLENLNIASKTNPHVIVIDNGSNQQFVEFVRSQGVEIKVISGWIDGKEIAHRFYMSSMWVTVVRSENNVGVWPTFKMGYDIAVSDVIAYLHNDLMVYDEAWDEKILKAFEEDEKLGLIGFIGSNEQDADGGRGLGTMSNFQGRGGVGSPAEIHGKRVYDLQPAFVVDGCSMIMRRTAMEKIGWIDFPPHHFYDRMYSLLMHTSGFRTAVFGIACDHISGQTANTQKGWHDFAQKWCVEHNVVFEENWDHSVYKEAERRFLSELHKVMGGSLKIKVDSNYSVNFL